MTETNKPPLRPTKKREENSLRIAIPNAKVNAKINAKINAFRGHRKEVHSNSAHQQMTNTNKPPLPQSPTKKRGDNSLPETNAANKQPNQIASPSASNFISA